MSNNVEEVGIVITDYRPNTFLFTKTKMEKWINNFHANNIFQPTDSSQHAEK